MGSRERRARAQLDATISRLQKHPSKPEKPGRERVLQPRSARDGAVRCAVGFCRQTESQLFGREFAAPVDPVEPPPAIRADCAQSQTYQKSLQCARSCAGNPPRRYTAQPTPRSRARGGQAWITL